MKFVFDMAVMFPGFECATFSSGETPNTFSSYWTKESKTVLLKTFFKHVCNFQLDCVAAM
jgi:hypothetical protein